MIEATEKQFRAALTSVRHVSEEVEAAIDAAANAYVLRCREERKQLRKRLTAGLPMDEKKFSQIILTYRLHNGYVDLYWAQIYYRPGSNKANYKRISNANGTAHLTRVSQGAINSEEAELIRTHEIGARYIRRAWSDFLKSRSATRTFLASASKVLDEPEVEVNLLGPRVA